MIKQRLNTEQVSMITLALKLLKVHAYFSFGLFICEQTFEFIKLEWNAQSHKHPSIIIYSNNVQSGKEKCGELTMRKLRTSISYSDGVIYPTLFMLFADWVDR